MSSKTKLDAGRIHTDLKQGLITLQEDELVMVTELLLLHSFKKKNCKSSCPFGYPGFS